MAHNVSLHQLEVFCAVMDTGAFARAAERLMIGQPSVSIQVQRLEAALGVPLFIRHGRSTKPTEAAHAVYAAAQRMLAARGDLARTVEELKAGISGTLRVGAGTTIGDYLLPGLLGEWRRAYPNIELAARVSNTREVVKLLKDEAVDLAFLGESLESAGIETRPWLEDRVVVLVTPDSPLSVGRHAALELTSERFIFRERGSATRATAEACLVSAGVQPKVTMTLGSNEAVKRAVAAGLGITMLSAFSVEHEIKARELTIAQVDGLDCRRMLYIAWDSRRPLSKLVERFVSFSMEWAGKRHANRAGPLLMR